MTVTIYRSEDAGAPVLSGTAGALINVLTGCLVTGYGAKAAAGWSLVSGSTSTIAAYRQGVGSNERCIYIPDTTTSLVVRMYESMTDINTGTGPVPDPTWDNVYITKSSSSSTSPRPWIVLATDRTFHLLINIQGTTTVSTSQSLWFMNTFGDFQSHFAGDQYNQCLIASDLSTTTSNYWSAWSTSLLSGGGQGAYCLRGWNQLTKGLRLIKTNYMPMNNVVSTPMINNGSMPVSKVYIHEEYTDTSRGTIPGVYSILENFGADMSRDFTFTPASGPLAGKTLLYVNTYSNNAMFLEISDTWDI